MANRLQLIASLESVPITKPTVSMLQAVVSVPTSTVHHTKTKSSPPTSQLLAVFTTASTTKVSSSFPTQQESPPLTHKDGRGYPDVSAQGLYFAFWWNGTESSISGTSASCPLMSSIVSLVNDALISSGKPPLGFLNPWLYKSGYQGFTDVLSGNTSSCGTAGFPVTKGMWKSALLASIVVANSVC